MWLGGGVQGWRCVVTCSPPAHLDLKVAIGRESAEKSGR